MHSELMNPHWGLLSNSLHEFKFPVIHRAMSFFALRIDPAFHLSLIVIPVSLDMHFLTQTLNPRQGRFSQIFLTNTNAVECCALSASTTGMSLHSNEPFAKFIHHTF